MSDPQARPSSKLPPKGNVTLSCALDDCIGHGSSGVIFGTKSLDLQAPADGAGHGHALLPLVLKMGRKERCTNLMREAWFYEEMGVAIPRGYGLFFVKIPDREIRSGLRPWQGEYIGDYDPKPNTTPDDDDEAMAELVWRRNMLFVLVLERLEGGCLH